jgi:hypothetical protein
MARANCRILDNGDPFPALEFDTVAGERMALPRAFGGGWGVILLYRGDW